MNAIKMHMDEYMAACAREGFASWSLRSYRRALNNFCSFIGQQYPAVQSAADLSREMIAGYQMHLYKAESRYRKRLSLSTQYSWMGIVLWWLRWLTANEKILINPGASIQLPKRAQRIPRNYLSLKEMQKLLRSPDLSTHIGLRNRTILEVLYSTGIRSAELRKMKVEDINMSDGWITIHGKGAKDRVVPIGKAAAHFIQLYLDKTRPKLAKDKKHSICFVTQYGTAPLSYESLNQIVQKTARAAGVKRIITPHGLRHTCATLMLRGRADIRYIQELLGHSSLSSTQIYTRVEIGDLKKVHTKCHPREKDPIDNK